MNKLEIGNKVRLKDNRIGIVEDYDDKFYYVRDNYGVECKILKDAKEDFEKFRETFGEELYNRYLELKNRLKSPYNDLYYLIKNVSKDELKKILDDTEYYGTPIYTENEDYVVFKLENPKILNKLAKETTWCIKKPYVFSGYEHLNVVQYFFLNKHDKSKKYIASVAKHGTVLTDETNHEVDFIPNQPPVDGKIFHGIKNLATEVQWFCKHWDRWHSLESLQNAFKDLGEFNTVEEYENLIDRTDTTYLANYLDNHIWDFINNGINFV